MIISPSIEDYTEQRKQLKSQLKQTKNENIKNNIKIDILDNQRKEAEDVAAAKKEQIEQKKQEIKEEYHYLNDKLIKTYRKIGIITSNRQINERFNKSSNYMTSTKIQNHFPKLDFITSIIDDIDAIIYNIEYFIDDFINKETIKRVLTDIEQRYKELKIKIISEMYM